MRRSYVAVDLIEIAVIGEVDPVQAETNLARATVMPERNAEVSVHLRIERKEHREALAVGQAHIILPLIYFGIRKTGVQVKHRPKNQGQGKMKRPPYDDTVRNI